MAYKVGDKVRIISQLTKDRYEYQDIFVSEMDKYLGTVLTIAKVFEEYPKYVMKEDSEWLWTNDMIEGLVEECIPSRNYQKLTDSILLIGRKVSEKMKYNFSDKVRIVSVLPKDSNNKYGNMFLTYKDRYFGTIMTIKKILHTEKDGFLYFMEEDSHICGGLAWSTELIEGLADEEMIHGKLNIINGEYIIN